MARRWFRSAWLRSCFRVMSRTATAPHPRSKPRANAPRLEGLEDRVTPATDITISTGPTAGGAFVGGVFTLTGNPATANVNNVEIQNLLNAGTSVTIDTTSAAANPGDITVTASVAKFGGVGAQLTVRATNTITVTGGADIVSASNQLNVTLNSDRDANGDGAIALGAGSVVDSNGGSIVLGGGADPLTAAAQGTASQPIGITLNGAQLVSGAGAISLLGRGNDLAGSANHVGIQIVGGSLVQSTGGNVTLVGTGGAGTSGNTGVAFSGAGTLVTSADGDIQITGIGGAGTTNDNVGVSLVGGAQVSSTGTTAVAGTITVTGTRGSGTDGNHGVFVSAATVTSVVGAIQVGTSGGGAVTGINNIGVYLLSGQVTSTGTGATAAPITITGTGGAGIDSNRGVVVEGSTLVTSVAGAIQITGTGAGSGSSNRGVELVGGTVSSTGTGATAAPITVQGTGSAGTSSNVGVFVSAVSVTSIDGNIQVAGTGGLGSGNNNSGVDIRGAGQVSSTGTAAADAATITITGTGGAGTDSNHGVVVFQANSRVTSVAGAIQVTGTVAGPVTSGVNQGVYVLSGGTVSSTGTGANAAPITLNGTGGAGTSGNNGVFVQAGTVTSTDGNIQIAGTGGAGSGTDNRGVDIRSGGQVTSTGTTAADAATITITGTGGAGTNANDGVLVFEAGSIVSSVAGAVQITGNASGPVTGDGNRGVYLVSGGQVASTGTGANAAPITISGTGGNGTNDNQGVLAEGAGTGVTSTDGAVQITGTAGALASAGANIGVFFRSSAQVTSTGTGATAAPITITGTGGGGTSTNDGVRVEGAAQFTSIDGNVQVTGTGGAGTGNGNRGVEIVSGGRITSTGTTAADAATLTITGTGGAGTDSNDGVEVVGANSLVASVAGAIQVTGTVAGPVTTTNNRGVGLFNGGQITSTGTGANAAPITVTGTGGAGTNVNVGVVVSDANTLITSVDGNIQITGTGGPATGNSNRGVQIAGGGQVTSTGTTAADAATITITGIGGSGTISNDGVEVVGANSRVTSVAGAVHVTGTSPGPLTANLNHGVYLLSGGQVTSTGTGADAAPITLNGTGGNGTGENVGVRVEGTNSLVTSIDGNIQITGRGGNGTGSSNRGVDLRAGGRVTSTGTTAADAAAITIDGTGGAGTLANDGVLVTDATSQVTSAAGAIQIAGSVAGPVTADNNLGVNVNNGAQVSSTGTGANAAPIAIQGTGGNGSNNNLGVAVQNGGLVTSVEGDILFTGQGGNGSSNSNTGVGVRLGGQVSSTGAAAGAATITFNGTGGTGTSFNAGVSVENAGSLVTSIAGDILLVGQGGDGSTDSNFGVAVRNGGVVSSTGTAAGAASITLNGTGGDGTDSNHGVAVELVGATVTSVVGAIVINGQADGSGASNIGVLVGQNGTVGSAGAGASAATITINGTGGPGTTQNYGVDVESAGALVTSVDGAVSIAGTGGAGSADSNAGVAVRNGGAVRSTGTGATAAPITVAGTGGTGTDVNFGVEVSSTGSTITSVDGDVAVTGQGGAGSASLNVGVFVSFGGVISSTGTTASAATVTLDGTGGVGTFNNWGVDVEGAGARVTSVVGAIQITGTGGAGSNVSNVGATVRDGGVVSSTGTGADAATVAVVGTGGAGTAGNFGVEVTGAGALITSVAGNLTVNGTGAVPAGSRVVNGDFGTGDFTGWTLSGDSADAFVTPSGPGFAAALTTSPTPPAFGFLTQNITTTIGRTYLVSFDVTGDGATPNSLVATLGGTTLASLTDIGAGTSTFTATFTATAASNLLSFQFQDDSGFLFLTNVSVVAQGSGPGANNDGVRVSSSGAIESTGAAAVTVTGAGSTVAGASGRGVRILSPGTIRAPATGNVTINGTGSGGNADIEWDNLTVTKTGGTYTFNDTVLGTSTLTANAGSYNVTFNDGGTITGAVTLNDTGTVTLGSAGDSFTFGSLAGTVPATAVALNANQLTVGNSSSTSFAGTIAGAGAVVKQGSGTLSLSNPNSTFTGSLTINQGSVAATGGHSDTLPTSALGNPAAARNVTVNAGASLQLSANDVLGNFAASPAATLVVNGGTVTSTGAFFNILGPLQLNGGTLSAPSGGANPGFQAFSLFGSVTVGGAAASTISTAGPNNGVHLNTSTTFDVADATGNVLADLIISAPLINRTAGHGGAPGALVKAGVGTATLSGASTYTGTTTVNAGTLLVTGSITSDTTVNSGATLGGTGTIAGTVLANAGATVAPGTSPGILNVGSTTFTAASTFAVEINGATVGTQYDQLNVTGTVALGGATLSVTLGAFTPANSAQFVIINNDGADAVTGTFAGLPEGTALTLGGNRFVITYVGGTGNDVVLIAQELPAVTLSLMNDSLAENGGVATVVATLSMTSAQDVTVDLDFTGSATNISDYMRSGTSITILAGSLTGSVTITGADDLLDEPDETVVVDVTGVTNGIENGVQQVTATITDDDPPPTVSIDDVAVTEGDAGTVTATFTVTLSAASGQTVTVSAATADDTAVSGADYVAVPATMLTFTPGQTSQTFTVTVNADLLDEINETFFVNLSGATNATIGDGQGVGTITDDDPTPSLSIDDVTVTEGDAGTVTATFTIALSAPSGQTVTVSAATADGAAVAPGDYAAVAATTVAFNPGVTTQTFAVTVVGDTFDEFNETYFVNLSGATNATIADAQGVGTVTDDDIPTGGPDAFSTLEDTPLTVPAPGVLGNDQSAGTPTVTVDVGPATGTLTLAPDGGFTYTPAADVNGTITFTYRMSNGTEQSAPVTVTLTVGAVNDAPSFTAGPDQVLPRGAAAQTVPGWATAVSAGPADEAGQALTFLVTTDDPALFSVQPAIDPATGTLTYTPAPFVFGTATVTVRLMDGGGTASGGADTSAAQTFSITVNKHPTESRDVSQNEVPVFATGGGPGSSGAVTVYNGDLSVAFAVGPFADGNGVRAVLADATGDGVPDVIAGTGPGVTARVVVIDGVSRQVVRTLTPFESSFTGGTFVAAGDVTGDGVADVLVAADVSGGARVVAFDGATGQQLASFFGIEDAAFRGGARVAVGDVNADGLADVVVAAGAFGGPRVAVFDGASIRANVAPRHLVNDFFVFEQTLRDGVFVTVGDLNGDGFDDMIFSGGTGGGPRVLALDSKSLFAPPGGQFVTLANFFAADQGLRAGARLAAKDFDGDRLADLVTSVPTATGSVVAVRLGADLAAGDTDPDVELTLPGLLTGVFVG